MRYLPHTTKDIQEMLDVIGKNKIEDLFSSIPEKLRVKNKIDLPLPLDEKSIKNLFNNMPNENNLNFLGAGVIRHFIPEATSHILSRSEWTTNYTPYQAEVSQGTLQAVYEFQTILANIYGCDIANASLYDGATALAEALLMTFKIKKNTEYAIIPSNLHPEYYKVCATYLNNTGFKILTIPFCKKSGQIDISLLIKMLNKYQNKVSTIVYQIPNFFGCLEDQKKLILYAKKFNTLIIAVNTDPLVFGTIKSPGSLGVDIVVGEGIGFCKFIGLGSPGLGLFATRKEFLRLIPGRISGMTIDKNNKRCFVLTMATREQHIRREKATSNICTNSNFNALSFLITLSLYGKTVFILLAQQNIKNNIYFRKILKLKKTVHISFNSPTFNEIILNFSSKQVLENYYTKLLKKKIYPGLKMDIFYPHMDKHLLITITEMHTKENIDLLVKDLI